MKIEIWSDIMCPFCYIGKRKLEEALEQFPHKDEVEINWKSYQLNPSLEYVKGRDIYDYLAENKGISRERAQQMNEQVAAMAREVGLNYDFENVVVANTFDAHRLLQLAAEDGLQNEVKERLLKAYFLEGRNVADHETLVELGTEVGMNAAAINKMLASDDYATAVKADQEEVRQYKAGGVPFFVFNRRFGVSGAQPTEVFLEALQNAWKAMGG